MDDSSDKRLQAWRDIAAGLAFLAVTAVGAASLAQNEAINAGQFGRDPGPGLMPTILLALLGAGALALTGIGAVRLATASGAKPRFDIRPFLVPAALIAALALYILAIEPIGFIETTAVFALIWTIALGWQDDGRPPLRRLFRNVVEAALIVFVVWLVFAVAIKVPLP